MVFRPFLAFYHSIQSGMVECRILLAQSHGLVHKLLQSVVIHDGTVAVDCSWVLLPSYCSALAFESGDDAQRTLYSSRISEYSKQTGSECYKESNNLGNCLCNIHKIRDLKFIKYATLIIGITFVNDLIRHIALLFPFWSWDTTANNCKFKKEPYETSLPRFQSRIWSDYCTVGLYFWYTTPYMINRQYLWIKYWLWVYFILIF